MSEDDIKRYYEGEQLAKSDPISEQAKNKAKPFLGKGEKEPVADKAGDIHPMDFVLLTTDEPALVGNHPFIALAFKQKVPGRVIAKNLQLLGGRESYTLSRIMNKDVTSCYEYHVIFFTNQDRPFIFWEPFLKKVQVEDRRPHVILPLNPPVKKENN